MAKLDNGRRQGVGHDGKVIEVGEVDLENKGSPDRQRRILARASPNRMNEDLRGILVNCHAFQQFKYRGSARQRAPRGGEIQKHAEGEGGQGIEIAVEVVDGLAAFREAGEGDGFADRLGGDGVVEPWGESQHHQIEFRKVGSKLHERQEEEEEP